MASIKYPHLSRLLSRDEMWETLGDFEAVMKTTDETIRLAASSGETGKAASLLHDMARDHFHLFLVGQYKIRELGRGIATALAEGNDTVLLNLTRAFIEHTAAIAYQLTALEKALTDIPKKPALAELERTIARHHKAARALYYNEKAVLHVNTMISELVKHYSGAKADYDELCEFVHPNYGSNKLVSSGELGLGQVRPHTEELGPVRTRAMTAVERCVSLLDSDLGTAISLQLVRLGSWTEIACAGDSKLSQIFSVRGAVTGDGNSKATALHFRKARTHLEAMEAFYAYLTDNKLTLLTRQTAGIEDGFLYDEIFTNRGRVWVKYKIDAGDETLRAEAWKPTN